MTLSHFPIEPVSLGIGLMSGIVLSAAAGIARRQYRDGLVNRWIREGMDLAKEADEAMRALEETRADA